MAFIAIPCKSAIPAWALLYYNTEALALEIFEIISGTWTRHLLFKDTSTVDASKVGLLSFDFHYQTQPLGTVTEFA